MTEKIWGDPRSSHSPVIMFHGLPGIKSKQNQDLAAHINAQTQRAVLLPFGEGLGINPGMFTFTKELQHKGKLIESFGLQAHPHLTLIGHSWGGLQALLLAAQQEKKTQGPIKQVILMSPLMGTMPRTEMDQILTTLAADHPEVNFAPRPELLDDSENYSYTFMEATIPKIPADIHITYLQAADDPITPAKRAKGLLPLFKTRPDYTELDCDHQFLVNRHLLFAAILKALRN